MAQKSIISKLKEAGNHSIVYGLGSALQTLLGFVLIPFYTRYYSAETYGVLSLIMLCGTLVGALFWLGASSALSRSYFDYEEEHDRKKAVSTSLAIALFGASIQILLGFFLKDKISWWLFSSTTYSTGIFIIFISSAFGFLNNLFLVVLRFQKKSKQVVVASLLSLLLTTGFILYFLVVMNMGVMAPLLGGMIGQVVVFVLLLYLSRQTIVPLVSTYEMKVQLQFGVPAVLIGFSYYVLDWVDRLFIDKFCSLSDVGIYSLGYKVGMVIHVIFIIPFSQIWAPMRMEYRNDANANDLQKKILTYYFVVGILITSVVSLLSKNFIGLVAGRQEYVMAYRVVPVVMLGHLIYGTINIVDIGIYLSRKISYHLFIILISIVVNVALNYLFIPRFGYIAAAYNTLASYAVTATLIFLVSNRLQKVYVEADRLIKVIVFGLLVMIAGQVNISSVLWVNIFVGFVLMLAFVLFIGIFILNENEKSKISSLLKLKKAPTSDPLSA